MIGRAEIFGDALEHRRPRLHHRGSTTSESETYHLVGAVESDVGGSDLGRLPVGRALVGRKKGDKVTVSVPSGPPPSRSRR
jgi:transcription elongation GreA/GreB family factor